MILCICNFLGVFYIFVKSFVISSVVWFYLKKEVGLNYCSEKEKKSKISL